MAKDKKKFDLAKGSSREFNTAKGGSRKFDLVKEADEPVAAPSQSESQKPAEGTPANGGKKWIWIAVAVVVIALLAWLLVPGSNSKQTAGQEETTEAAAAESTASQKSDANDDEQTAEPAEEAVTEPAQQAPAQAEPNNTAAQPAPSTQPAAEVTDDVEAEAQKVIRGVYGDGKVRKDRLGSRYHAVQKRVNELKRQGAF